MQCAVRSQLFANPFNQRLAALCVHIKSLTVTNFPKTKRETYVWVRIFNQIAAIIKGS